MDIGIAIKNNFPADREVRARKIAKSLHQDGDDVRIFARNDRSDPARGQIADSFPPTRERLSYATVHRFSWGVRTALGSVITAPIPFNPFWILWLILQFRRTGIDVVVASDLRAGSCAVVAAKLAGVPVVVDLRENHTELVRVLPRSSLLDRIVKHPGLIALVERTVIAGADQLWVVTPERKRDLPSNATGRTHVVSNTPLLSEIESRTDGGAPVDVSPDRQTLVYVGLLNDFRGLDPVIESLELLVDSGLEVELIVAGEGPHRLSLEAKARLIGVSDRVQFIGWIDAEDVPAFLAAGDIGLVPHDVNSFTNTTVPNKLFDCMSVGIPVATSNMDSVARIVEDVGCGRVFRPDSSPPCVAATLRSMLTDDNLAEMGRRGRAAVLEEYKWQREAGRIRRTLDSLV